MRGKTEAQKRIKSGNAKQKKSTGRRIDRNKETCREKKQSVLKKALGAVRKSQQDSRSSTQRGGQKIRYPLAPVDSQKQEGRGKGGKSGKESLHNIGPCGFTPLEKKNVTTRRQERYNGKEPSKTCKEKENRKEQKKEGTRTGRGP